MLSHESLKSHLITRRIFLLALGKLGLFFLLIGKLLYLQIFKSHKFRILSDKNRINLVVIPPKRGSILDSRGTVLALNTQIFCAILNKGLQPKIYHKSLAKVYRILDINKQQQQTIQKQILDSKASKFVTIAKNISWQQVTSVEEQIQNLPGIYIDLISYRQYAYPLATSHILGYLSSPNKDELGNKYPIHVGKNGIEKSCEEDLKGLFGTQKVEINAHGVTVRELDFIPSTPGSDISLSINSELQNKLYSLLEHKSGAAILTEVNTGKVRACVSTPGYDVNSFSRGITYEYWNQLVSNPDKPLINKVTQGCYPPGSIFKIVTALAALEYGIDPNTIVHCSGSSYIGNIHFKCWNKFGHHDLNMLSAIKTSCNTYMYHIAKIVGYENIMSMARKLGLGEKTGIDLPDEAIGLLPSAAWKKKKFKSDWRLGDTLNSSIGQGFITVTPLQLVRMMTSIANGKKLFNLSLLEESHTKFKNLSISNKSILFIQKALSSVMNERGGIAYSLKNHIPIAGKTGTAQVKSKSHKNEDFSNQKTTPVQFRNHGLFAGFAPHIDPKYAVSVVIEHGSSGLKSAAPIAKAILLEALNQ